MKIITAAAKETLLKPAIKGYDNAPSKYEAAPSHSGRTNTATAPAKTTIKTAEIIKRAIKPPVTPK